MARVSTTHAAKVMSWALGWGVGGGLLLAGLVLFVGAAPTEEPPTDFLRFRDLGRGEGKLQTAIVSYAREDGLVVDLVSAVHVGDAAYYRNLERRFQKYDSLLYEMVKPYDVEPVKPEVGSDNLLSAFQRGLKNLLGLEFQLDAIDYTKKNFVHADLDPETFFRLQREKGENFLSLLWKVFRRELELQASGKAPPPLGFLEIIAAFSSEDSARSLKLLLARQMEDMELLMAGLEDGKSGSVIVSERNKVAVEVLRRTIKKGGQKRLGIFYGAAHMPDLERRLQSELGLKKTASHWVTAWDVRKKRDPGEADPGRKGEEPQVEGEPDDAEAPSPPGKQDTVERVRSF